MTVKFDKNENGEIIVSVTEGTDTLQFSYIEMIKQLLNKKSVSISFSDQILAEEKSQIEELFDKINRLAIPTENNTTEQTEQF